MSDPILTYLNSVDVCNTSSGSANYQIELDSSDSVTMIEYRITDNTQTITTSYIAPENFQPVVDGNTKYNVYVPLTENGVSSIGKIQMRVLQGTAFTSFSNILDIYPAPVAPLISEAYFMDVDYGYNNYYNDQVYVVFNGSITTDEVIVSYMYTDKYTDNVELGATAPMVVETKTVTDGSNNTTDIKYVTFTIGADVKTGTDIMIGSHAIYDYGDSDEFSAVSCASNSVIAQNTNFDAPVLEPLTYNYSTQEVVVTWSDSTTQSLDLVDFEKYFVYISTDDVTYTLNTTATDQTVTLDMDTLGITCGQTLYVKVSGISIDGESALSNSESVDYFSVPAAVQFLDVGYIFNTLDSSSNTVLDFEIGFENPSTIGCGTNRQFLVELYKTGDITPFHIANDVDYDASASKYVVIGNDIPNVTGITDFTFKVSSGIQNPNDSTLPTITVYGGVVTTTAQITNTPVISNMSLTGSNITFDVVTNTLLDVVQSLVKVRTNNVAEVINWSDVSNAANPINTNSTGNHLYQVTCHVGTMSSGNKIVAFASNGQGMGTKTYTK